MATENPAAVPVINDPGSPSNAPLGSPVAADADASVVRVVSEETDLMLGQRTGQWLKTVFGRNSDIDTGGPEDIWEVGGTYTGFPTGAAETVTVTSSDAADTALGTGARTITLEGLDAAGDQQVVTIPLAGLAAATTTGFTWTRVNRAYVATVGTGGVNAGVLTVTHTTTTANVFAAVQIGFGQSQIAAYTIPAGHTGWLRQYAASMTDTGSNRAEMAIWTREPGGSVRLRHPFVIATQSGFVRDLYGGLEFPALTDIAFRCIAVSNDNGRVSASFGLQLVEDTP